MNPESDPRDQAERPFAPGGEGLLMDSVLTALLLAQPGLAVIVFDTDLRCRVASGAPLGRHGFAREHTVGRPLRELVPSPAYEQLEPAYLGALRGETVVVERETVDRGAVYRSTIGPLRDGPRIVGGIAVAMDVTARRREQALLRDADAILDDVFLASPIGVAVVAPDGRWLKVNPALCRLLGRDADTLLDGAFMDVTHPDDLRADVELVRETLRGDRDRYELEKRYLDADGHTIWAHLTVTLIRGDDGAPRWFVSQIMDVTVRRQLEAELRRRSPQHWLEER